MKHPSPDFLIRAIPRNMDENPDTGWNLGIIYSGPTSFLDELLIHAGVLSGQKTPHPPHCHDHEELHINLSEHFEFVSNDAFPDNDIFKPLDRNSLVFTDSNISHTLRNAGSLPGLYLHIRWKNKTRTPGMDEKRKRFYFSPSGQDVMHKHSTRNGVDVVDIHSGPSLFLPEFKALFITIPVGESIPLHRHHHEVIFVLVTGSVEILGRSVDAPGFAFMGSQMPHHVTNHGTEPAELYAFELHQEI